MAQRRRRGFFDELVFADNTPGSRPPLLSNALAFQGIQHGWQGTGVPDHSQRGKRVTLHGSIPHGVNEPVNGQGIPDNPQGNRGIFANRPIFIL